MRRDHACETMGRRSQILLAQQPQTHRQCAGLLPHPLKHPPNGHGMQGAFIDLGLATRCHIPDHTPVRLNRSTIRAIVAFQVTFGELEERGSDVTLIGEYESRDNR